MSLSSSDHPKEQDPAREGGSPVAVLTVHFGDQMLDIVLEEVSGIGRLFENLVCLRDSISSRHHAEIRHMAHGGYEIFDLGSTHGTYVNRKSVQRQLLQRGDEIIVGATLMTFGYKAPPELKTRRQCTRVACALPVRVVFDTRGVDTNVLDLSLSGARLAWKESVSLGVLVTLKIAFPRAWRRMTLRGRTVHSSENGLGVVFTETTPRQQEMLAKQLLRVLVGGED